MAEQVAEEAVNVRMARYVGFGEDADGSNVGLALVQRLCRFEEISFGIIFHFLAVDDGGRTDDEQERQQRRSGQGGGGSLCKVMHTAAKGSASLACGWEWMWTRKDCNAKSMGRRVR